MSSFSRDAGALFFASYLQALELFFPYAGFFSLRQGIGVWPGGIVHHDGWAHGQWILMHARFETRRTRCAYGTFGSGALEPSSLFPVSRRIIESAHEGHLPRSWPLRILAQHIFNHLPLRLRR